jgi:hypothetical protein
LLSKEKSIDLSNITLCFFLNLAVRYTTLGFFFYSTLKKLGLVCNTPHSLILPCACHEVVILFVTHRLVSYRIFFPILQLYQNIPWTLNDVLQMKSQFYDARQEKSKGAV